MTSRRLFSIAGLVFAAISRTVTAQPSRRIPRIGVLWHAANAQEERPYYGALLDGFSNLGYVAGRNIVFEHRFPNEIPERFGKMAAELVALKVDVLVGVGAQSSQYVKAATSSIPIVFMYVPDPVRSKLVESLARPGGNASGLTNYANELTGIRLQFLTEIVPGIARVAFLVNPDAWISRLYVEQAQAAATKLGITVQVFEARALDELEPAFDSMVKARMQGVTVNSEGLFFQGKSSMAILALARRLPLSVWSRETLEAGALMSYGTDQVAIARRVAVYADKILRGAKVAEIPVEQPTRFEFLINERVAKELGLAIPHTLLLRADQLIK